MPRPGRWPEPTAHPRAEATVSPDAITFVAIAVTSVLSIASLAFVGMRVHAYWRRSAEPLPASMQGVSHRLARLEQAVDEIAVDLERIGEMQRFLGRSHQSPDGAGSQRGTVASTREERRADG
jgi:hypothetical protein